MADLGSEEYIQNGKKFALVLLIDVSSSMSDHVDDLSIAYANFIENAKNNDDVRCAMDVAVITFNDKVCDVYNGFTDVNGLAPVQFKASGCTCTGLALEKANQMVRERTRQYKMAQISAFTPWIVLMTDGSPYGPGEPDSTKNMAYVIKQREQNKKVHLFTLGVGTGFNKQFMMDHFERCMAITDWNFDEFFSWLGKSVANISTSTPGDGTQIVDTGQECQDMVGKFFNIKS